MYTKDEILNEIKRTTEENNGIPPGQQTFRNETGIKSFDWGKYWARFGDAVKEAGLIPNKWKISFADDFLIKKMIFLIRKFKKYPTVGELRLVKEKDSTFPFAAIVNRKQEFIRRIVEYCEKKKGYSDIIKFCVPKLEILDKKENIYNSKTIEKIGEVYLLKSSTGFKIGRSYNAERRIGEIGTQLPQKPEQIHSIKTDDPRGVESYWHKRFKAKHIRGEWFRLNTQDVKSFKRWKQIY